MQHIQRQAVAAQAAHTSQAQLSASGNAPPSRRSHRSVTMHSLPLQPWPSVQMSPAFQVGILQKFVSCWLSIGVLLPTARVCLQPCQGSSPNDCMCDFEGIMRSNWH